MRLCGTGVSLHWSVLQQRTVVHSSSSVQEVPEHCSSRVAVSLAGLWLFRHDHVVLQRAVGLKAPVEYKTKSTHIHMFLWFIDKAEFYSIILSNKSPEWKLSESPLWLIFCHFHPISMVLLLLELRPIEEPQCAGSLSSTQLIGLIARLLLN